MTDHDRKKNDPDAAAGPREGQAKIPSDRDETPEAPKEDGQHRKNREPIRQAHADVESGVQDTERIGVPTHVPSAASVPGKP